MRRPYQESRRRSSLVQLCVGSTSAASRRADVFLFNPDSTLISRFDEPETGTGYTVCQLIKNSDGMASLTFDQGSWTGWTCHNLEKLRCRESVITL
jgi:hypothetical protein